MQNPLISFILPKPNHQADCAALIIEGMKKHDITRFQIVKNAFHSNFRGADLAVMWGWRPYLQNHRWHITKIKQAGRPILVMERAYVGDRFKWYSLGYNGLNGHSNFYNKDITDLSRWNKHFPNELKPWRKPRGKRVLVCGQCAGDASIHGIDINSWYDRTCHGLIQNGYNVTFREHPLNKHPWFHKARMKNLTKDGHSTLEESLINTDYVVTYNSNSGVVSVLNGIPTVTCNNGAMAYSVTGHDPLNLPTEEPNREAWCAKLAYTQWLPSEITSGESWEHLKVALT